jgi:hypothetical protein
VKLDLPVGDRTALNLAHRKPLPFWAQAHRTVDGTPATDS